MLQLIIFRALQGLGGGGLIIGAQTIVGDVVSPRERGKYMGLFMAMFGVTTILGPLIGGALVDSAGWRWIFYINIPLGAAALVVGTVAIPGGLARVHRQIDYLGTALLSAAATALVLFTSLGGVSWGWASAPSILLAAAGVVSAALFVWAEHRAAEPVIPMSLFRNRVFASTSAIAFVVGFAMFGALTFLPLFLQVVKGVSPTTSGVRLFPMMGGLLVASIGSGQLVSRWGRYKVFPVVGTALMTVGLYLMSTVGVATGAWVESAYMVVFGMGLGLTMGILVVAVQNAVPYEMLGVATSGNTFFRMIGGSFGTAVFGAVFSNLFGSNLRHYLHGFKVPPSVIAQTDNPKLVEALPPHVRDGVVLAFSHTVQSVFLIGVPIGALAFLLSWLLPEVELRKTIRTTDPGEEFRMPEGHSSLQEVQQALDRVTRRENRREIYRTLAERAGLSIDPDACWMLYRLTDRPGCSLQSTAGRLRVPADRLRPGLLSLEQSGMATRASEDDSCEIVLTDAGRHAVERLTAARRQGLMLLLDGWDPDEHPELQDMVKKLAHDLLADDDRLLAAARPLARAS
jgi:MFS family permease